MGFDSTEELKSHIFFKDIDWHTISLSDPTYKPAAWQTIFNPQKSDNVDEHRRLFYGSEQGGESLSNYSALRPDSNAISHERVDNLLLNTGARKKPQQDQDFQSLASYHSSNSTGTGSSSKRSKSDFYDKESLRKIWVSGKLQQNLNSKVTTGQNDDSVIDSSSWGSVLSDRD